MPQIEFTDDELEKIRQIAVNWKARDSSMPTNTYVSSGQRMIDNILSKIYCSMHTPAEIVLSEMDELGHRTVGPKDIDAVLSRIKRWSTLLRSEK